MPYIKNEKRIPLRFIEIGPAAETPGELVYLFTILAKKYIEAHGEKYEVFNDVIGALEGTKLELYRRKVAPYEDKKINENGEVW